MVVEAVEGNKTPPSMLFVVEAVEPGKTPPFLQIQFCDTFGKKCHWRDCKIVNFT